jgi:hypothetical protein
MEKALTDCSERVLTSARSSLEQIGCDSAICHASSHLAKRRKIS